MLGAKTPPLKHSRYCCQTDRLPALCPNDLRLVCTYCTKDDVES
jgi:hypothetical protein